MKSLSLSGFLAVGLAITACGDDGSGGGGATGSGGDAASSSSGQASPTSSSTSGSGGDTGSGGAPGTGGDTSSGGAPGTGGDTGSGGDGAGGGFCVEEPFEAASEDAFQLGADALGYLALASAEAPSDDLAIELYSAFGETGTREIDDTGYESCDPCVLFRRDCDENLSNCSQYFLAYTGFVEVEQFDDTFAGRLSFVQLQEVTIDDDLVSTPVPGGEEICMDDIAFEALIQTGD